MTRHHCLPITILAGLISGSALADGYFCGLGNLPGGTSSTAGDVSHDGAVVAGSDWVFDHREAFRWTVAEGPVGLGFLPATEPFSIAYGVSGDGRTIVGCANSGTLYEAYRWTKAEGMVGLGHLPGGNISTAWNASADGSVIVGVADGSDTLLHAFRWTPTRDMVMLPDLPGGDKIGSAHGVSADGAVIVGSGNTANGSEACRWVGDDVFGLGVLPGGENGSFASNVSADGTVIVGGSSSALTIEPDYCEMFRWTEDLGLVGLGDLPGGEFHSQAMDVSADGSVIVGMGTSNRGFEAIIWDADHGMRSLFDVLTIDLGLNLTGWSLTAAQGVSADGLTIVGNGTAPSGESQGWIARIPEPGTILLITLGAAVTARRRHRRV